MPGMSFGTFHLFSLPDHMTDQEMVHYELDQAKWLEEYGYDEMWLAEHNARKYGIVGSLQVVAAAAAAATKRIRIGAVVTRLPLHHPLHTAEDMALVDVIANGRFDWGLGKGYDRREFATYGVPYEERDARWEEAMDIVLNLWRDGRIDHRGRFWTIPNTELFPKPVQKPHPPTFLMVSRSDDSVVFAAKRLMPIMLGQAPDWDDARHKVQLYRATALAAGHAPGAVEQVLARTGQLKQVHVAATAEQTAGEYKAGLMWYFAVAGNRLMFGFHEDDQPYTYYLRHKSVMLGSPESLADEIAEWREYTGVSNLICWFNCGGQPRDQVQRSMQLFSEKVMPRCR